MFGLQSKINVLYLTIPLYSFQKFWQGFVTFAIHYHFNLSFGFPKIYIEQTQYTFHMY